MSDNPTPDADSTMHARRIGRFVTIAIPLIYGGLFRFVFATDWLKDSGGVVSLSFVLSVPLAFGALSVALGRWRGSNNWLSYALIAPTISLTIGLIVCFFTKIEALICIIMAAPIMYGAMLAGGLIAHFLLPQHKNHRLYLPVIVLLPLITAPIESSLHWPTETKAIENTITIHASPEIIWEKISSVDPIPTALIPDRWIYFAGFPKPIAATLDHPGVGGIRTATFERNVSFFETIVTWDRPRKLAFTIHADPHFIPHTAFDQHIIVGGRFYDVLDGIYEVEPLSQGQTRLRLTSHHRLSTRFNAYAAWWSEKIMNQIQGSILEVIKQRCEIAAQNQP